MKKRNARKGFTIVELVIVIAVIAILAAVLIPTFSGVVEKAQDSAFKQNAANAYKEALADALEDGVVDNNDSGFTIVDVQDGTDTWTWTYVKDGKQITYTSADNSWGEITDAPANNNN